MTRAVVDAIGADRVGIRISPEHNVQGATELVLTLAEGADARTGSADGAVYLTLYPIAPDAPAAGFQPAGHSARVT